MQPQIVAAIIGLSGVVLGALLKAYEDEIKNLLPFRRRDSFLRGSWQCHWTIEFPSALTSKVVDDVVRVIEVRGGKISVEGSNADAGPYKMDGKVSTFGVSLLYNNQEPKDDLVGVVLLERDKVKNRLTGYWSQISQSHGLVYGKTEWRKL